MKDKPYSGKGYIITNFRGSRKVYRYISSLTKNLNLPDQANYHRFLVHIYASMLTQMITKDRLEYDDPFVPVYSRLIEKHFGRDFDVHLLKDNDIIEIKPKQQDLQKSREFRLNQKLFNDLSELEGKVTIQRWRRLGKKKKQPKVFDCVNLVTGRKCEEPVRDNFEAKSSLLTPSNIPKLIKNSIKALSPCPFNPLYVRKWVIALNKKYFREQALFAKISDQPRHLFYNKAKRSYQSAKGRYLNDSTAQTTIINQQPVVKFRKGKKLLEYKAAYSIQTSGRITEKHGGFQTASKMFKQQFVKDVPNIYNYDLKNSQANILYQELQHCGIDSTWMEDYLSNQDRKIEIAEDLNIPVGVWKECFYSLIMGANTEESYGAVSKALYNHFQDKYLTNQTLKAFGKVVKHLIKSTNRWRKYLYNQEDDRYHYRHAKMKFWKNACGMRFKTYGILETKQGLELFDCEKGKLTTSKRTKAKCERRVTAFILQGQEACFIHYLTLICKDNQIPVYKNEYDGLVTGKEIPEKLVFEAGKLSGLKNPKLELKDFASEEQIQKMKKFVSS